MATINDTGRGPTGEGMAFVLPEVIADKVMAIQLRQAGLTYNGSDPEHVSRFTANVPKRGSKDVGDCDQCPTCNRQATTVAVQLTYQQGEPHALYLWCEAGHSWRWTSEKGRQRLPDRWQA